MTGACSKSPVYLCHHATGRVNQHTPAHLIHLYLFIGNVLLKSVKNEVLYYVKNIIVSKLNNYELKTILTTYVYMSAKSLQSYLTPCHAMDSSPPDSSIHGILGKNTGVGCYALLQGIFPIQGLNPQFLCLLHW